MGLRGGLRLRWRRRRAFGVVAVLLAALVTPIANASTAAATSSVPAFDHIFVIVLENRSFDDIIGNSAAPYLNSLANQYGVATQYHAIAHPSLPNYLALTGGSTFGVTTDCNLCYVTAPNLAVDRVEASGRTWKAYMESMAQPCALGDTSLYAQHHDPFVYYDDIRTNPSECNKVVPYTNLSTDLASTATTPNFGWITPNLCDDMHNCSVATGDAWLQANVPAILNSPAFTTQNSLLAITFDEDDNSQGNQVPTILAGSSVTPGLRSTATYDHYSLLKTIETAWGLAPLTTNDANAVPMADFFNGSAPQPLFDDGFDRSVVGGWGSAPVGGAWTVTSGPASDFSVGSSAGSVVLSAAGNGRGARALGVSARDVQLESVISSSTAATGFGEMTSLVGRRVATNREYRMRVRFASNGQILLGAVKLLGTSTEVSIGSEVVVPGLTFTPGVHYRVRARFVGASPTTILASLWPDGGSAPPAWQLTQTDSEASLQTAGSPGVHVAVSTSATALPVTIKFDSFTALTNVPPTAAFTPSCTHLACSFDGSASSDPDGTVASYAWNFGDGSAPGSGVSPAHTYAAGGTYPVTLTVTDNGGLTSAVVHSVVVAANVAPTAAFTFSCGSLLCSFDATGSADSDGTIASYAWDFGDLTAPGSGVSPSHSYAGVGTYLVTLTVTDNDGATGSVAKSVPVGVNSPPVAAFTSSCTYLACSFDGSSSSDSDGTIASYAWVFGDGSAGGTGVNPSHSYGAPGSYPVTLTVTDNGGAPGSVVHSVVVVASPPTPLLDDGFDRSVVGGWGSAPVGGAWTVTSGPASDFSVGSSVGSVVLSAAGTGRGARALGVVVRDVQLESVISSTTASTGFGEMTSLVARRVANNREYRLRVRFSATGQVFLGVFKLLGTSTEVPVGNEVFVPGVTFTPGTKYRVRARFVGASPTTISASLWLDGNTAPAAWQLTQTDSEASLQVAGSPGVHAALSTSATTVPVTIKLDSFTAQSTNVAPAAVFTSSCASLVCSFDGTGSSDSDGTIASYVWVWGDGSPAGTGTSPSHTFAVAGTYPVTLTVTDNGGLLTSVTNSVVVS